MIDMTGIDFGKGPDHGIYLMAGNTSAAQVGAAAGKRLSTGKRGKAGYIKGWDGGRFIPGDVKTSADAAKACGLDWLVERHPIIKVDATMGVGDDGTPVVIGWEPRKSDTPPATAQGAQKYRLPHGGWDVVAEETMNVRSDTGQVLGIVGPGWQGPQNHEAFSFVDDLVDDDSAKWLGGGEVKGGKRIWMVARLAREAVLGGDVNERSVPLCYFSNGWDGFSPMQVTVAPYRLACLNGQTIPLEGYVRTWKARHTTNHKDRLLVARQTLELSIGYFDAWAVAMEQLMTAKVSQRTVERNLTVLFPDPAKRMDKDTGKLVLPKTAKANVDAKREAVLTIYRDAEDLQHLGQTKYRLLNAVTAYADWHVTGQKDAQVLRSAEPSPLKDKAYQLLTASR